MADAKKYESVSEMLRHVSDDEVFNQEVEEQIAERQVVKMLQAIRTAKGVPQASIARELNCSQSRVSKIENGADGDLRLQELEAYVKALGCDVHLLVTKRSATSLDRIRHFAFCIHEELCRLTELAHQDEDIARGVADTFGEVLLNQINLLQIAARKLPNNPETDEPYIKIDMIGEIHRRRPHKAIRSRRGDKRDTTADVHNGETIVENSSPALARES